MDYDIFETFAKYAGVGGLALGIFLILFRDVIRKNVFSQLTKEHSYRLLFLITVLIWALAISGLGAWVYLKSSESISTSAKGVKNQASPENLYPTDVTSRHPETIQYGTRMGMVVAVVSKKGLDTDNAIITTKHTRENAIAFCRDYAFSAREQCIEDELSTKLNSQISANCETGTFTNFYGEVREFRGLSSNGDASATKYIIADPASGEIADGSFASGYHVNLDIFRALCPGRFPSDY
jgi:hypothetical protein